jgi:hypothetical protein
MVWFIGRRPATTDEQQAQEDQPGLLGGRPQQPPLGLEEFGQCLAHG